MLNITNQFPTAFTCAMADARCNERGMLQVTYKQLGDGCEHLKPFFLRRWKGNSNNSNSGDSGSNSNNTITNSFRRAARDGSICNCHIQYLAGFTSPCAYILCLPTIPHQCKLSLVLRILKMYDKESLRQ